MGLKILSGNEALAHGALRAGVKLVAGYPGTPTSRAIAFLLALELKDRHIEWSVNEKVALEVATGAAWSGFRSLCTMKMSGLNVAYDSLISIAYSGIQGGMVIYVADDPGVSAGMAEQDSRGFAYMSDLPMLEPATVKEVYDFTQLAFDLSEQIGSPVFIRLVTAISNSRASIEVDEPRPPAEKPPLLEWNIQKYTKAGSAICTAQHLDLIARLERSIPVIEKMGLNRLDLAEKPGGLGIISSGITSAYIEEGLEQAIRLGMKLSQISLLKIGATNPFPEKEVRQICRHCDEILVLEELEPYIEQRILTQLQRDGLHKRVIGKMDGTFSRVGEYSARQLKKGLNAFLRRPVYDIRNGEEQVPENLAASRPITVCAGCPHRGTFMAINSALRKLRYKKHEVMVTGDIGCTILGMNPPFDTVWNEISMGASISLAQGFVWSGVQTPVIATIGDSTFFHGGIPGLINAIHHQTPLTLIILDNGWTAMTGMQANPGTLAEFHPGQTQRVDIARLVPALGVEHFFIMDPFDLKASVNTLVDAIQKPGVKVVLSRRECAIQSNRRGDRQRWAVVDMDKCVMCKLCITQTGCPAISIDEGQLVIDIDLCNGCGLCLEICNLDAIHMEGQR